MVLSVVGRLKDNYDEWKNIGANDEVLTWIREGVSLPFKTEPTSYENNNHKFNVEQFRFADAEINKLLKSGAISQTEEKPFCINAIGCVPKKNKSFRLIVDLRPLNQNINVPYFKHEGIDVVCDQVLQGDEFISIDLKDGFHHIAVNRNLEKF